MVWHINWPIIGIKVSAPQSHSCCSLLYTPFFRSGHKPPLGHYNQAVECAKFFKKVVKYME